MSSFYVKLSSIGFRHDYAQLAVKPARFGSADRARVSVRAEAPRPLSAAEAADCKSEILTLLGERNARLVAHYYTESILQELAEESGGFVGDSLEMARFGHDCDADILVVAGVRFMGETAKILSPDKTVLMPTLGATCSLDIACPIEDFGPFCDAHPDREVVVYANTSAAVKARADWIVTSSIALDVAEYLSEQGKKILWAPDKHLGSYVQRTTGADVLLWDAACIVHEEFKARGLADMQRCIRKRRSWRIRNLRNQYWIWPTLLARLPRSSQLPATAQRRIYRGNRQGDISQAPANFTGQNIYRRSDSGRRRYLPKLRSVSLDGDEFS